MNLYSNGVMLSRDAFCTFVVTEDEDGESSGSLRFCDSKRVISKLDVPFTIQEMARVDDGSDTVLLFGNDFVTYQVSGGLSGKLELTKPEIFGGKSKDRGVFTAPGGALAMNANEDLYRLVQGNWTEIFKGPFHKDDKKSVKPRCVAWLSGDEFVLGAWRGEAWHVRDGAAELSTPVTPQALLDATIIGDGEALFCGRDGTLMRWNKGTSTKLNLDFTLDLWSVQFFKERIFASTLQTLVELKDNQLVAVNDDTDEHATYNLLSANEALLLSLGRSTALLFDGSKWIEVNGGLHDS